MLSAVKTGKTSPAQVANSLFFSKEHFPKFLGTVMACSGVAGWQTMAYIKSNGDQEDLVYAE
jgi:hypothetical protein